MIYPNIDPKVWAEMYDISMEEVNCPKCGLIQTLNIPFAAEHWRGLEARVHACGSQYQASAVNSIDKKRNLLWKESFQLLDIGSKK